MGDSLERAAADGPGGVRVLVDIERWIQREDGAAACEDDGHGLRAARTRQLHARLGATGVEASILKLCVWSARC
jgi:hypothetical protein